MEEILKVENLCKIFALHVLGGKMITRCKNISFSLPRGAFLGLLGPSGVGKSTILKCIYRTYLPTSGFIRYLSPSCGEIDLARASDYQVLQVRQEMSYVAQFLRIIPRVPAIDIVAERLWQQGWVVEEGRQQAGEYLTRLGITRKLWDAYPVTFSGGEQQRINLARALITRPRLLLLDEPTASLDAENKRVVLNLLAELKSAGTSIIGIFHDLEAANQVVDNILILESSLDWKK
jgi:alpha-D-ribose 1-methylphosphonate 5-triphosphate synthase subunit PhnL